MRMPRWARRHVPAAIVHPTARVRAEELLFAHDAVFSRIARAAPGQKSLATQQSRYIHQGARKGSSSRCSLSFSSSPWRPRDGGLSMWGVGSRSPAPWPAREIELLALATLAALAQISTPSAAHFLKSHQKKFAADRDRQKKPRLPFVNDGSASVVGRPFLD
jgi:hypothetical protein